MPRFSLLVPTRDRARFLSSCLESLVQQTFTDFEVIVSDGHTHPDTRRSFDRFADERFKYVTPPGPFSMGDNWEFAYEHSEGDYLAVIIDKTVLHPSTLERVNVALEKEPADIVTWWNETYFPLDEDREHGAGTYLPGYEQSRAQRYDPREELSNRCNMHVRRGLDGTRYYRAKICFGAFARPLLDRMRSQAGRIFFPLSPDYTSMTSASVLATSALDLGRPFVLSLFSKTSNGRLCATNPAHARRFVETSDPSGATMEGLPVRGLYSAQHNLVAYDYVHMSRRLPEGGVPEVNMQNLLRRCREDLTLVEWGDQQEQASQYRLLEEHELRFGVEHETVEQIPRSMRSLLSHQLARRPGLDRALRRLTGRATRTLPTRYESIVDAARAADAHYTAPSALSADSPNKDETVQSATQRR